MSERLDRLWPSLVALVGTVAVVLALLAFFGDDTGGGSADDDLAAGTDDGGLDDPPDDDGEASQPSGEETADGGDESTEPDDTSDPDEPTDQPTTAPPELRTPIGIANQTSVPGLEEVARERIEAGGWEVAATSGFNGTVPETTVYYPPGFEEQARALSRQFPEIGRVAASFEGINQTRLVVILVEDYLETVDE